jgi:excisionase family DNA binding protein
MTVRELARYLDCHPTTIYRLLRLHEVPAFRLGGGWRFRRDTIEEWIEELTKPVHPSGRATATEHGAHTDGIRCAASRDWRLSTPFKASPKEIPMVTVAISRQSRQRL